MADIRRLDSMLAARIAAGEVIERPQSVVRELVDNALDAKADEIALSIRGGGIEEIRLADNGCGMHKEDLPLSIMQYATSKISKVDDLYDIHTMGFRGEALHSIAAVSRLTIASRREGDEAWTLSVDNLRDEKLTPGGPDRGTVVTVEELFGEIPARRAFLKRAPSEATLCRQSLLSKAMAFPSVHFTYSQDGAMKVDLPRRLGLEDRVLDILTLDERLERKSFVTLSADYGDFSLTLVTSLAGLHRSDRSRIKIYVNSRQVDEFSLVQAIVYGYGEILPGGAFPYSVLFVEDEASLVDFNIHPAKREVKLRNKAEIHHAVQRLVATGLPRQIPTIVASQDSQPYLQPIAQERTSWVDSSFALDRIRYAQEEKDGGHGSGPQTLSDKPRDSAWLDKAKELFSAQAQHKAASQPVADFWSDRSSGFRYIGQAFRLFLICEKDGALYLVDQHAAHERILFNTLRKQRDVQRLLVPIEFEVDGDVDAFLQEYGYIYTQYGLGLGQKEDRLWELTSLPASARGNEKSLVAFIQSARGSEEEIEAGLYAVLACKGAIKAGDYVDDTTAKALLEEVFALDDPSCPHGRTFVVKLSEKELRAMVGRTS